jgi:hypothetical protein
MIKELVEQIGVTEDVVINWETRNIKPKGRNLEKVMDFIKGIIFNPAGYPLIPKIIYRSLFSCYNF